MNIKTLCLQKGIKLTEQRELIFQIIADSADHPDVEDIYRRANIIDPKIGLSTVYRTVNLLVEHGVVAKLEFGEGKFRYEATDGEVKHHHHLIDLDTGAIIEFYDEELERIKVDIASRLGYDLIDHKLELYGIKRKK